MTGLLLPQVAAALRQYADACTNPRTGELPGPRVECGSAEPVVGEDGALAGGDGALAGGDGRGRAQQLHDVLAVIIGLAARVADAPSLAGNAPTRVVSVKAEDLVAGRGVAFADGGVMSRSVGARRTT